jgi:GDP-4-dehydro-6-deoxy-D-mannose reductase
VPRRVLVTGANGFAGRHLVSRLLADADVELHAWHRPGTAPVSLAGDRRRVRWHRVDVRERNDVRLAVGMIRPDELYHLAGAAHVAESWRATTATLDVNIMGTHFVLDELRLARVEARVLVAGSATVYAPSAAALAEDSPILPSSPYALSKLAQEMLALRAGRDDGLPVIVARAFNHVGPGQEPTYFAPAFARQLAMIESGRIPPVLRVGNLDARRDLTDVRDTVRAYVALMARGRPGRVYNVCSGQARVVREVLDALVARCRLPVTIEVDPGRLRPNDVPVVLGSAARLQEETGWEPAVPFDRTLADLLDDARTRLAREAAATPRGGPR